MTDVGHRYALIFERRAGVITSIDIVAAHRQRLSDLARSGRVAMAGPFEGGGGLVVLDVGSRAEAEELARTDPFVLHATHEFRLVRWLQDLGPGAVPAGPSLAPPADGAGG
jgi:uncharacterized protein YciI